MAPIRSLLEVINTGVDLSPAEAVAIVQQLIASPRHVALIAPLGAPSLRNVVISSDGSVACHSCASTPGVLEMAILLDAMLPRGGPVRVSGGLRYTIARGLLEVEAPPFDSIADFHAALARHEQGDREEAIRDLYVRSSAAAATRVVAFPVDRRRHSPSVAELRRQLREADERMYLSAGQLSRAAAPEPVAIAPAVIEPVAFEPVAIPRAPEPVEPEPHLLPDRRDRRSTTRAAAWILSGTAAAVIVFSASYAVVERVQRFARTSGVPARSAAASTAPLLPSRPLVPLVALPGRGRDQTPDSSSDARQPDIVRAASQSSGPMFSPSFASNGTALFFHTGRSSDSRSALEAADLSDGFRVMTIVDDGSRNYHVQPSPDGSRVAFDSDRDGERGIYIANRDGSGVRRVSGSGYAAVPTWSPDGQHIAFARAETDRAHVWNLWLLSLADGEMRRLTNFRYGQTWSASWFADGRRISYTHEDRLAILDLESGAVKEIASPVQRRLVRTAAVSPDGRHIVFQVSGSGAWLLNLSDGSMRCILSDPTAEEFAWSPDGRRVAFHSRRGGQWGIWLMTPD